MIYISPHLDVVKYPFNFELKNGVFTGLLDNYLGSILSYSTILSNHSLIELVKQNKISIIHSWGEEFGILEQSLIDKVNKEDDVILVVDVFDLDECPEMKNKNPILDNISGITDDEIEEMKKLLIWSGFDPYLCKIDLSNLNKEDETYSWAKLGYKTISVTLPINGSWHRIQMDNTCNLDTFCDFKTSLEYLIRNCLNNYY